MTSPIAFPADSLRASIILLTYNQEQFVEEAFLSLLNQDMEDLEIVVSDDCSSDGTWEKIQAVANDYFGSKKIILSRNISNMGIVNNFTVGVKQSIGDLIFMAAGDDISLPDRCSKTIQFWRDTQQQYDLVATDAFDMAYDGTILDSKVNDDLETWTIDKWFEQRPYFFGASHMVTRKLLDLAPLDGRLSYEDQCLVFRAILMGGATRLPLNLICHRRGGISQQNFKFRFGHRRNEMTHDLTKQIEELEQFLRDATALSKRSLVENFISIKMAYYHSILDLFGFKLSPRALIFFWRTAPASLSQKIRYSRYYLFYPILAIIHCLRDSILILKNACHAGRI